MRINVLGPLEAYEGSVSIAPTAGKQRQVFVLLALAAGKLVTTASLQEELWGGRPPRSAATTLQTYIMRLRRRFELLEKTELSACRTRPLLQTYPGGYLLDVRLTDIDAHNFRSLAAEGRRAFDAGDLEVASALFGSGLALWRGPALMDVMAGPCLELEKTRFEQTRLEIAYCKIDVDLRLGRHRAVLSELAVLCKQHPFHEGFHAQYMAALYWSNQPVRALEVYKILHEKLLHEAGVEPSHNLRDLHQAILTPGTDLAVASHLSAFRPV